MPLSIKGPTGATGPQGASGQSVLIDDFTASGGLQLDARCKVVEILAIGGGGGGGGGAKRGAQGQTGGGGVSVARYDILDLANGVLTVLDIIFGNEGLGGFGASAEGNGEDGVDGCDVTVTDGTNTLCYAEGGQGGVGGRLNASADGGSSKGRGTYTGGAGGAGRYAGTEDGPTANFAGTCGGSGGGRGSDDDLLQLSADSYRGGAALTGLSTIAGASSEGAAGTSAPTQLEPQPGGGGTGGAGHNGPESDGGAGGNGSRGGGGGGGGAKSGGDDGGNGGNGGNGGAGFVRIIQFFGP